MSVSDVNRYLRGHLTGYQNIDRQGSYGFDTLVKPLRDEDEYDADIQVVMNPTGPGNPGITCWHFETRSPRTKITPTRSGSTDDA